MPAPASAPGGRDEGDYRLLHLNSAVAQRLLDAAKTASDLVILGATGDTIALSSLRGLRASLLAMDEAQRRIGTTTALARAGTRAPTTIPVAPSLPIVRVVPYTGPVDSAANATLAARLRRRLGTQLVACHPARKRADAVGRSAEPRQVRSGSSRKGDARRILGGAEPDRPVLKDTRTFVQ